MASGNPGKKSTGRKKIAIEKLESNEKRQVTFSKRRTGLTNKASELCILCGAEIAIITSSPMRNRFFAFGHPNVDSIVDRFLGVTQQHEKQGLSMEKEEEIREFGRRYLKALRELQTEKEKIMAAESSDNQGLFLWRIPIERMEVEELEEYMDAMNKMREKVSAAMDSFPTAADDVVVEVNNVEEEEEANNNMLCHFIDPGGGLLWPYGFGDWNF